jgi:rod shape-determining protein MreB
MVKIHAIITVPCGVSEKQKELFENVAYEAGINQALIVESPIATRQTLRKNLSECLVIDIGGGKTDISITDKNGILCGCSLGVGGNNMDTGIMDFLSDELKFKLGLISAANSRIKIGSLNQNESSSIQVNGRDLSNGAPIAMEIDSKNIYSTVLYYYQKIAELTKAMLLGLDEITFNNVQKNGAFIMGGAAQIPGLTEFLERALCMPVNLMDDPAFCAARGAGRFLEDKTLMQTLYI